MLTALIILLVPAQIYSSEPAFSVDGFDVYEYGATDKPEKIRAAFEIAAEVMGMKRGFKPETLIEFLRETKLDIHVRKVKYGDPGSCPSKENPDRKCEGFKCELMPGLIDWCVGLYMPSLHRIDYVYRDCIGSSSIAHELIHAIEWVLTEETDPTHADPDLFPDACVPIPDLEKRRQCYRESAERLIQSALRMQFCEGGKP